jgi:hypothetical protein
MESFDYAAAVVSLDFAREFFYRQAERSNLPKQPACGQRVESICVS